VSVAARRAFCYPDIAVACFPFELIPGKTDTLTNPTILIEVLSPSTRAIDRNRKVPLYRDILSLMGYLLVEQERISVEYGHRIPGPCRQPKRPSTRAHFPPASGKSQSCSSRLSRKGHLP